MPRSSGQYAMPRCAIRLEASATISLPSNAIEPSRRGTMPMIERSVVVLPAPLRPSSVTTSPAGDVEADAVEDVRLAVPGVQLPHGKERRPAGSGRIRRRGAARDRQASAVPMYACTTSGCFDTCA